MIVNENFSLASTVHLESDSLITTAEVDNASVIYIDCQNGSTIVLDPPTSEPDINNVVIVCNVGPAQLAIKGLAGNNFIIKGFSSVIFVWSTFISKWSPADQLDAQVVNDIANAVSLASSASSAAATAQATASAAQTAANAAQTSATNAGLAASNAQSTATGANTAAANAQAGVTAANTAIALRQLISAPATLTTVAGTVSTSQRLRLLDQAGTSDVLVDDLFSAVPTKNATGKIILASDRIQAASKTNASTRTVPAVAGTATIDNAFDLILTAGTYEIRSLMFHVAAGNVDFRYVWFPPAGFGGFVLINKADNLALGAGGSTEANFNLAPNGWTAAGFSNGQGAGIGTVKFEGVLKLTATGTLSFGWCPDAAGSCQLTADSYVIATRIV